MTPIKIRINQYDFRMIFTQKNRKFQYVYMRYQNYLYKIHVTMFTILQITRDENA